MSSSATTIKIYFTLPSSKQEIRRFTTSEKEIFPALLRFLESTYSKFFEPPLRFLIQYDDGEDLLTVSSEVELQEGLSLHAASGGGSVLKLLCRFDDSPVSTLHSPTALSGMSTPSVRLLADFPPSPSMTAAASQVDVLTRGDSTDSTVQVEQPVSEKEPLQSATSPKSDEEDIVDVHGSASDDEYVRIEESAPQKVPTPVATVATPQPVAVAQPVVETAAKSEPSPPVAAVPEVDPFAPHMEERAPERWACRLCTKQFRARHFLVEHLKRHFPPDYFTSQTENDPVTTTTTTTTASAGTSTEPQASSEFATQTASTVSETSSTQTAPVSAESTATQTTETTPVACTSPPLVDETPAAPAAVEIADVTGHHEHCDASPEPSSIVEPTTTPTSSTSSSSTPSDVVVHHGVTCDGCGQSPLTGNRYHCTVCTMPGGFDLCESCERSGSKHPQEHVLLKMRTPAHIPVGAIRVPGAGRCPMRGAAAPTGPRPRAAFVSDVTLADGLHVHAGETLRKVWSLKNVGDAPWPLGTRLVFAGGDLAPDLASGVDATAALVPFAGPGEVVHVAIDIIVPNEPGRFRSTFRLESPDGSRFGPRVWIDVIVPQEEQQPAQEQQQQQPAAPQVPQPAAAAPVVTLPVAQPVVKSVAVSSPPLQSAPASAPAPAAAESKQNEEAALASELAAVQVESSAEKPKAPQFQYSNQLATLRSMGFRDVELCRYLLLNNQGDLEKAVSWLLANAQ